MDAKVGRLVDWAIFDIPPGENFFKIRFSICSQKAITGPMLLYFMYRFNNFTPTACVIAALQSSYSVCWLAKEAAAPDRSWERKQTPISALGFACCWPIYWVAPFLAIKRRFQASPLRLASFTFLFVCSVILQNVSDIQKNVQLKHRKELITNGYFGFLRHPNYAGELLLYTSIAAIAGQTEGYAVMSFLFAALFLPRMLAIERSLSRYHGWEEYKKKTYFLFPFVY